MYNPKTLRQVSVVIQILKFIDKVSYKADSYAILLEVKKSIQGNLVT